MNITLIDAMLLIVLITSVLLGCLRLVQAFRRGDTVSSRTFALLLTCMTLLLLSKMCDLKAGHGMGGMHIWEQASWALFLCALPLMLAASKERRAQA